MPTAMFGPALSAAKAGAAHVPMLATAVLAFVVLMSMPMHQKSSLLDIVERLTTSDLRYIDEKIYLSAFEFQGQCPGVFPPATL
jgi:hypothetical protein